MLADLDAPAKELAEYMSDLSELAYCAGWMEGLEFELWTALVSGPREYGRLRIDDEHISRLRGLSDAAKGWICFGDDDETFVPLETWEPLFARWQERQRDRR